MDVEKPLPTTSKKEDVPSAVPILAGFLTLGFFSTLLALLFVDIPLANVGSVNQLIGILAGAFSAAMAFYFGSSLGSKKQGNTVAELAINHKDETKNV